MLSNLEVSASIHTHKSQERKKKVEKKAILLQVNFTTKCQIWKKKKKKF